MIFSKEQINTIIEHAKSQYPEEVCGILAGKGEKVEEVYEMKNTSDTPVNCYFMDAKEQLDIFKKIRKNNSEMIGIYHSHPQSRAYPSPRDCELAFYSEASYAIISLEDLNNPVVRAFTIVDSKIEEQKVVLKKNILFVCVENSCRSQLAQAIANNFYGAHFAAYSAGSKPSGIVNPLAIEVMKEEGIDISEYKSKGFGQLKDIEFDYVITLGCGDVCPIYPAKQRFDWKIEDPKNRPIEFFRETRESIKQNIERLLNIENV